MDYYLAANSDKGTVKYLVFRKAEMLGTCWAVLKVVRTVAKMVAV